MRSRSSSSTNATSCKQLNEPVLTSYVSMYDADCVCTGTGILFLYTGCLNKKDTHLKLLQQFYKATSKIVL